MEPIAVKIDYWTLPDGTPTGIEPDGIDEFRHELQQHYVSLVRGQSGACGGGLYDLIVQVTSSITLRDVANVILGGVAYDMVKTGTQSFILRPLIQAIKKLREQNTDDLRAVGYDEFRFAFQDADIIIKNIGPGVFEDEIESIFSKLSKSIDLLKKSSGEMPYVIHIPVFKDPEQKITRFRSQLDVDETIQNISAADYLKYWGVRYNLEGKIQVFDMENRLLIDERYMTQDEYWTEMEKVWERGRAKGVD